MEIDLEEFIHGKNVIGIGTGTTIERYIPRLSKSAVYVPSSIKTMLVLMENGLMVSSPLIHERVDLYIDGADYFDKNGNLIKGKGGALTTEKILCSMAEKTLIIVQNHKYRETFKGCFIPVEVIPVALMKFISILRESGCRYHLREGDGKIGPVITDLGNCIVDVEYNKAFFSSCKMTCGVVEHGLIESGGFTLMIEDDE